jgi:hypothetical protein
MEERKAGRPRIYSDADPNRKAVWGRQNRAYKAQWARDNRRRLRGQIPESDLGYPDEPDYPVAEDPPMTCPGCQCWAAKNDNAGFCGLKNQVTTRLDGCINFIELEGEF